MSLLLFFCLLLARSLSVCVVENFVPVCSFGLERLFRFLVPRCCLAGAHEAKANVGMQTVFNQQTVSSSDWRQRSGQTAGESGITRNQYPERVNQSEKIRRGSPPQRPIIGSVTHHRFQDITPPHTTHSARHSGWC